MKGRMERGREVERERKREGERKRVKKGGWEIRTERRRKVERSEGRKEGRKERREKGITHFFCDPQEAARKRTAWVVLHFHRVISPLSSSMEDELDSWESVKYAL